MITKITQKEATKIKQLRKNSENYRKDHHELVQKGPNGKWYKTDKAGMKGVKELKDYFDLLKQDLAGEQLTMFDL